MLARHFSAVPSVDRDGELQVRGSFLTTSALAFALLSTALVPSAKADEWDKETVITVKGGAVQIQGAILEPGEYVMKLADSDADRRILQLFNADESQLVTTILATAAYRPEPTGDTRFTFAEVPAGQPPAISTWFYLGDNYGLQFSVR
ncbi:MAG: hypothetical protein JO108_25760 [Acidobacteriaceae bacterium]|nr:hypothetical protein [Acidobacteriaceae bacterium]